MPKKTFNQKLKKLTQEIKTKRAKTHQPERSRIMITGSLLSNSQLIEATEEAGAVLVCDAGAKTVSFSSRSQHP